MDYSKRLSISYYKTIATLNESHKIYLVQHQSTQKIYVKKILDVYNKDIYLSLSQNHISGVPQIIDLYEEENQLIVIENYVSGCSLQEKIDTSDLNIDSIYKYMDELCTILEKLHAFQPPIIHRDIKPSNIIITEHDHVVLLDFNAAKYFTNLNANDTILLGTKGYAAPEQYGFGSSTPRTDIYALGILLKELTDALPSSTKKFDKIIRQCTQINPDDRYHSVTELREALNSRKGPVATVSNKSTTFRDFLFPGFRTETPWKILVSSVTYLFIFWLCFTLEVENTTGLALWVERIFCLLIMLSVIFGCFNYLDIQSFFPLCKHKNRVLHYIGIILLDIIFVSALFILMVIIEDIFFLR